MTSRDPGQPDLEAQPSESSGTPIARDDNITLDSQPPSDVPASSSMEQPNSPSEGEEQALESHEVIELQTFSERKAWIEEKIKVNLSYVIFPQPDFKS
jgi:hypothetical protein